MITKVLRIVKCHINQVPQYDKNHNSITANFYSRILCTSLWNAWLPLYPKLKKITLAYCVEDPFMYSYQSNFDQLFDRFTFN